jgi:hypothetical protein
MSREDLAQEWRERLEDFAQADTTIVEWCYFHRIPVHQFYYWKRRLAAAPPQTAATPQFLPVALTPAAPTPASATGVTVRIAGTAIELAPGFDPATLRAVVAALSALPC